MKHLVPTLSAFALVGVVVPTAFGASIKDDQMSLAFKATIQARADLFTSGKDGTGKDWDVTRNALGDTEVARFDLRRVRFGIEGKMGDWKAVITIRSEKNDSVQANGANNGGGSSFLDNNANTGGANNRGIQLYYANITRTFKLDDGVNLGVTGGLYKAFNAESSISSNNFLFPSDTVVDERIEQRNLGVGTMLTSQMINAGFDIQNNSTVTKDADAQAANQKNGLFYSARVETSLLAEWMPAKKTQSWAGKEGTNLVVGVDVQVNADDLQTDAVANQYTTTKTVAYGPDVLFHWNGLTAYAEYRMSKQTAELTSTTGAAVVNPADKKGRFWNIQAAYAMPVADFFVEPAIRFSKVDSNTSVTAPAQAYNTGAAGAAFDNGGDGKTIDIGINLYFDGHSNKLQISYQNWKAENGDGKASIIRIQEQLSF